MVLERLRMGWIFLAFCVLLSNFILYHSSFGVSILPDEINYLVLGSIFDFIVTIPLLIWLTLKEKSFKTAILLLTLGCIGARLIIPKELIQPFVAVTWVGFAIEGFLLIFELLLIFIVIYYIPKIIARVKRSTEPVLFAFFDAVNQYVPQKMIIQLFCSEFMMFYYALFAWKKKPEDGFTLYKNTGYTAFMMMIIHAIIIETLGIHWWLHEKSLILSMILLILNIYSVLFFIADMNALRLNPTQIKNGYLYLSMGLMMRAKIKLTDIDYISQNPAELKAKLDKQTAKFIVNEFQEGTPQMILHMKQPTTVTLVMGFEKQFTKMAIQCDQPKELVDQINEVLIKSDGEN